MGGYDLVRRMDRQGEFLRWRRKCSGYARQRMGPKLVNCCRPEQMGTNEFGKNAEMYSTLQQVAQQARNEIGHKVFEIFWQEEEELCVASWARWDAQWNG